MIFVGDDGENDQAHHDSQGRQAQALVRGHRQPASCPASRAARSCTSSPAKAVALKEALEPGFKVYMQNVLNNAKTMASALAAGGARIVSGGTDNHLMLVDLSPLGITGKEAEKWLDLANITVNKNGIPFDTKRPFVTSGIRVGTPALTTRGMGGPEMAEIAGYIMEVLKAKGDDKVIAGVKEKVPRPHRPRFPLPLGVAKTFN